MLKKLSVLTLTALLAGCMLGPNYLRPNMDLPSEEVDVSVFTTEQWWQMFQDPQLDLFEEEALANNKDLVAAMGKVNEARANVGLARADQLPTVGATGLAAGSGISDALTDESYEVGISAAFEVDLWGKYRRLSEAARAQLLAAESQKDVVRLALTADVARYYFAMTAFDDQLATLRRTLATREETERLYKIRHQNGYSSELELQRVIAERAGVQASVTELERQLSQAETSLALILGRSPRDIAQGDVARGKELKNITVIPDVPAHIPADLLTRRPDVRAAEGFLIAANANVGVARAAFFPTISLSAAGGLASGDLSQIFSPSSTLWNAGAQLMEPIFGGGRLISAKRIAEARYDQIYAAYEMAAQAAYKDTYDALVDNQKYRAIVAAAQEKKDALAIALDKAQKQKDAGLIGMIDVLDVERGFLQAELDLATAQRNQLNALVALSKALGGGWTEAQPFPDAEPAEKK